MPVITLSDGSGVVTRHPDFPSNHIAARHIDIWCPPGYHTSTTRYPMIYMHDGQNLFDPTLVITKIDWGMDEALSRLIDATALPGAIVVGVWHSLQRVPDYMPAKPLNSPEAHPLLERFQAEFGVPPLSDGYLRFLTRELKPFVDATYRTLPDQPNTFLMGSSMGGLISLYGLSEYPDIFGGAGCVSTHWTIGGNHLVDAMGAALPPAGRHRLYFDYGTEDVDAPYAPYQQRMDDFLRAAGYGEGHDWITRKFEGAGHSEAAWRARVDIPLAFLLQQASGTADSL